MHAVTLKADGAMVVDGNVVARAPLICLGYRVILAAGFTLRSFMSLFHQYPDLRQITAFSPEMLLGAGKVRGAGESLPIDLLELTKTVEMIGFPPPPRLEIYASLTGLKAGVSVDLKTVDAACLMDTPLCVGKLHHIVFGDRVDRFSFDTVFSLFEFVDGILWELSFLTGPGSCALRRP